VVYTLIVLLVIAILGFLVYWYRHKFKKVDADYGVLYSSYRDLNLKFQKTEKHSAQIEGRLLSSSVLRSLMHMDKTCQFYVDEDEANRELTTCLNLLGHVATYHYAINSRTADIFVDGTIIEGKLDPTQSDVDRLIGQVSDYLLFAYPIFVVVYGRAEKSIVDRIQSQIIDKHSGRVSLLYLSNVNRTRK